MVPFVLSPMSASSPPGPSPHDTGVYPARTYLFLDDLHVAWYGRVATRDGCRRARGRQARCWNRRLPWEGLGLIGRNCILWDAEESRFKCWYPAYDPALPDAPVGARRRWAYAESRDGLSWERPSLGPARSSPARRPTTCSAWKASASRPPSCGASPRTCAIPTPRGATRRSAWTAIRYGPGELTWTGPEGEDEWYRTHGRHLACGAYTSPVRPTG